MIIPLSAVTPNLLRDADVIEAIDVKRPGWSEQVFGQNNAAPYRPFPAPADTVRTVHVLLDSADPEKLRRLKEMVREAKPNQQP